MYSDGYLTSGARKGELVTKSGSASLGIFMVNAHRVTVLAARSDVKDAQPLSL
jgi:hypothetical protein